MAEKEIIIIEKSEKYTLGKAYTMWALSFLVPGLHRFYLGKVGSGALFFFTWGFGFLGTIVDFFNIPRLVKEANYGATYRKVLFPEEQKSPRIKKRSSPEQIILRTAEKNNGRVTPGNVAINGNLSMDEAKKHLDKLVAKGYAEMKIKTSGSIVYYFPDFASETKDEEFEDL